MEVSSPTYYSLISLQPQGNHFISCDFLKCRYQNTKMYIHTPPFYIKCKFLVSTLTYPDWTITLSHNIKNYMSWWKLLFSTKMQRFHINHSNIYITALAIHSKSENVGKSSLIHQKANLVRSLNWNVVIVVFTLKSY